MKLLLITQKVDENDAVLGFMCSWLREFSKHFELISVICLEKGTYELPPNVNVFSLGKENGPSRGKYISNFYRLIRTLRNEYDAVFVHMNPEYVVLGGFLWRSWGKKVCLWYNHQRKGLKLGLAMSLAHEVFYTSPFSASAGSKKSRQMPVGVDVQMFKYDGMPRYKTPRRILSLGRISPIKRVDLLLRAMKVLLSKAVELRATVVGGVATAEDSLYLELLNKKGSEPPLAGAVSFFPPEARRNEVAKLFSSHDFFFNASPSGLFDKTVFEAMATEAVPLVSSRAFQGILPEQCLFEEGSVESLSLKLEALLGSPVTELQKLGSSLRNIVVRDHSLEKLATLLAERYKTMAQ